MSNLPKVTDFLRTPDDCFKDLPDFAYTPHYTQVGGLRVAHIDEGPRDAAVVLLMHGEPTWSALAAPTNRPGLATTATPTMCTG